MGSITGRAQLDDVSVRLLEVIAHDLVVLRDPISGHALQPRGEALVHVGSGSLRHRLVGRIAHEEMAEPERVLTCER
jgi:hypothetical protein